MNADTHLSRRQFLASSALAGTGLVIAFTVPLASRAAMVQQAAAGTAAGAAAFSPNAYLRIGSDDRITVLLSKSEMGQGVWTTLPMLVAEELDADWTSIEVENGGAAPAFGVAAFGGMQLTGGSTSTATEFDRYRQAGAAARQMLVQAASARFGVPVARITTKNGEVIAGTQRARYGALADDAGKLTPPALDKVPLKEAKDWTIIGRPTRRLDSPEKVTGRAIFGMDVQFEGLLTAVVARSPVFGGSVKSFDASAAKAVPGVRQVVQVPTGIAVVADHYWAAKLGRDALKVEWDLGPHAGLDSARLHAQFQQLATTTGDTAAKKGTVDGKFDGVANVVDAEYSVPYLAHAPMEPLNCTVRISPDQCELWVGTQGQTIEQGTAAKITGLKPEQVKVHTTFLGGGFGRRANLHPDVVFEAVHVAKAANAPVKTVWSREDDVRGGFYRPAYLQRARVALGADGRPVAWTHALVGQSIMAGTPMAAMMVKDGVDATSVEGIADAPYIEDTPHHFVHLHTPDTGIPVLWWRSVGHSYNGFVMESLVDELAHAAGQDPFAYRQMMLAKHPRHLGALELAARKAGWSTPPATGRARGIAVHKSFGSYVAQVAEVSVEQGQIRVHRVVCAVDCGIAVNPLMIEAQIQSGIAFGLGAALHGSLTFKDGQVQESNYHDYRILRLPEMPVVEVHIVPSTEKPTGVGEPGTPPIAPAVANAVFALTGTRLRSLPFRLDAATAATA